MSSPTLYNVDPLTPGPITVATPISTGTIPKSTGSNTLSSPLPPMQRKNVPEPIHISTAPMTPPDTPVSQFGSWPMQRSSSISSASGSGSGSSHGFGYTSSGRRFSPPSPPSPLSLPPLMPEDDVEDDVSPNMSTGLLTPTSPPKENGWQSMDGQRSPPSPQREFRFASHSPLRKSLGFSKEDYFFNAPGMQRSMSLDGIPPHLSRKKSHLIANPYYSSPQAFHSTASYLMRVPRRMRPFILTGLCFFVIVTVFFSRAVTQASQMDILMAQRRASLLERRYFEDGLIDINGAEQAEAGHEAVLQVEHATLESHPLTAFASKQDELLALISFITATTANALPPLDPELPLDPEAILDFDPSRPDATEDFDFVKSETNTVYPIVLFGKMRDPWHREIQKVLSEFKITPSPLIVDIDQRRDHLLIAPLLSRIFGTDELPQLSLAGNSLGSYHEVLELRDSGKLRAALEASGHVSIREIKKKKKGAKERERLDNERVLAPKPIIDGF